MTRDEELMLVEDLSYTGAVDEYDTTDSLKNIYFLNDNVAVRVMAVVKTTYETGNTLQLDVNLYDGTNWITFHTTGAIAAASLVAGFIALDYTLPKDLSGYTELKVSFTEGDANFDAGAMDVFVTL